MVLVLGLSTHDHHIRNYLRFVYFFSWSFSRRYHGILNFPLLLLLATKTVLFSWQFHLPCCLTLNRWCFMAMAIYRAVSNGIAPCTATILNLEYIYWGKQKEQAVNAKVTRKTMGTYENRTVYVQVWVESRLLLCNLWDGKQRSWSLYDNQSNKLTCSHP